MNYVMRLKFLGKMPYRGEAKDYIGIVERKEENDSHSRLLRVV